MERLFSYGTLQEESVQLATFGRKLQGAPDALPGYSIQQVRIKDPTVLEISGIAFHPIVLPSSNLEDQVPGVVFEVTAEELRQSDEYEVDDYQRQRLTLKSGIEAWVYVKAIGTVDG